MADGPVVIAGAGELELSRFVGPGDGIVIGEACAEPPDLVDALVAQAPSLGGVSVFAGLSWRDALGTLDPACARLVSYGALGRLARAAAQRPLEIVPCHFSALPALLAAGRLPADVAMIQVSSPDAGGRCRFGAGAEYFADACAHARVVIAEVGDQVPRSDGASIAWEEIDVAVMSTRPLLEAPAFSPGEVERRIAAHVAELIQDGDTIQLGVGAIPEAVMEALHGHRDLGVHSGMITDGVLGLIESGVITGARKPHDTGVCVAGAALGSRRLFDALEARGASAADGDIRIESTRYTHAPATLALAGRLCAINSALEVDLDGQAGSESIDGRALGAIGGQVDFLRAAAASGGAAILALPAARIVERLHGPVSVARADVDWVVTEHGARSLRGLSRDRRRSALAQIAQEAIPA